MLNVLSISRSQHFALTEANDLLPIIFRITKSHSEKAQFLMSRIEHLPEGSAGLAASLEDQLHKEIAAWEAKVAKLGAEPRGLWLADFDAGDGYFCWKYPETRIEFWHGYNEGYSNRISVETRENVRRFRRLDQEWLQEL